jgi:hypothetical protein
MRASTLLALALLLPSAFPASARAAEGVIELNQARALAGSPLTIPPDAPGFPIEISQPGNYRLTSDLDVPPGANGIELSAADVRIDLGGFTIRGPEGCFPGSCVPATSGSAIIHAFGGGGFRITIRNGSVSGFGGNCIQLRDGGRVEDIRVVMCGGHGIQLRSLFGDPGVAYGNQIENTGGSGLVLEGGGLYRDNVILRSGLSITSPTIVGGTASGANLCGDGRCSRRGTRRYYLSRTPVDGSQPATQCAAGYHMASRWELADPSGLEYDAVNGQTLPEAGSGPPVEVGWARNGTMLFPDQVGWANCSGWSTTSGMGTVVTLSPTWGLPSGTHAPWNIGLHFCGNPNAVWCIED